MYSDFCTSIENLPYFYHIAQNYIPLIWLYCAESSIMKEGKFTKIYSMITEGESIV